MSRQTQQGQEALNVVAVSMEKVEVKEVKEGIEEGLMPQPAEQELSPEADCPINQGKLKGQSLPTTPQKIIKEPPRPNSQKRTLPSPVCEQPEVGCGCSKSGCLKLYCACFAKGVLCGKACLCFSCKNKSDNSERSEAINEIILKDDLAFSRRILGDEGEGRCNCRKSGCTKKYCQCYGKGKRCAERCTCFGCKNMKQGHLKTEQRTLQKEETFRKTFESLRKKMKLG